MPRTLRSRGYLPHLESPHAIYAVTFRLADSLPQSVLEAYFRERHDIIDTAHALNRPLSPDEEKRLHELHSERIETYLDQGVGECQLADQSCAKITFDAVAHFHPARYHLFAQCIMPNHVHALLQPNRSHELADILHSWKSYSAHQINKLLNRTGELWMREYYDHQIRDDADFTHAFLYIQNNPKKANLKNWPWVHPSTP